MPLDAIKPTGVFTAWVIPTDTGAGTGLETAIGEDPGSTNAPIIFEPPSDLSGGQTVIWIIASGSSASWGGAQVHVSLDDTTYGPIGFIAPGAAQGVLSAGFASGADPDTVNTLSVDLTMSRGAIIAGTAADADFELPTLSYCDGELVAFSDATLTAPYAYDLGAYLRRGCYATVIGPHLAGTQFAWIQSPFAYEYPRSLIGSTVYFKFPAFNRFGGNLQSLADCVAYPYVLTGFGLTSPLWAQSFSIGSTLIDLPVSPWDGNYEIFDVAVPEETTFPAGLVTSAAPYCLVPPTGAVSLTLQKMVGLVATTVGSADYSSGINAGSYTFAADVTLNPGERLRMYAPPGVDGTISGLSGTIVGARLAA